MVNRLISIGTGPSGARFRGAHVDGVCWIAAPDLYEQAVKDAGLFRRTASVRPSIAFLSSFIGRERHLIERKYRDFGFGHDDFAGATCSFLAEEAWPGFLKLSGVTDAEVSRLCVALRSEFDRVVEENSGNMPEVAEVSDVAETLEKKVEALQSALLTANLKIMRCEHSLQHLSSTVMSELRALSRRVTSRDRVETSREIKEQANRLYARAKQLENEGL